MNRAVISDGRTGERDGHAGRAGMAFNGIASDASAVRLDDGTASGS
jgi:hypothetical protein